MVVRVRLELPVVRGRDERDARRHQPLHDRHREHGPLHRIGPGAELVEQRERARSITSMIAVTCEEKVESDCSIDCSSPISAKTAS